MKQSKAKGNENEWAKQNKWTKQKKVSIWSLISKQSKLKQNNNKANKNKERQIIRSKTKWIEAKQNSI